MTTPVPIHPDAAWLYLSGQSTYPGSLPQTQLMHACLAAAAELGTRRKRSAVDRERLTENVVHLLRAVAIREAYGGSPGSMSWDIRHCRQPLREAAAAALEAEYRRSRHRVLGWAFAEALGDHTDADLRHPRLELTINGRRASASFWSHDSDAGHVAAIARLDELHRLRVAAEIPPTDALDRPE